ncbi:conserved protein of unknown function [Candidatus Filomicrobium marinum]|uniref:DUF1738 domain-containing protein n=1 Tax=Candidatus Filomicrobium marinum TaxID=1608628 RepID=A0A0D6JBI6_9HYPH|nr:zincin-like metallopeptidase domain-containing protein [Candidatus Filomicrobium marinum]CFX05237.1 conserved protein of unknown function [Candidatus Filomicrobium marinum]CPR16203.1 conserved protein of unknown function [Candidatus Filomicrobium marinum]
MARKDPLDIHQYVTDRVIAAIEANPGEFRMPWQRVGIANTLPRNAITKQAYQGVNCITLWIASELGQLAPVYATYRQWHSIGAQVRKGEKGNLVVFYKEYSVQPNAEDTDDDGRRRVARASWVFSGSQVDGYTPPTPEPVKEMEPLQRHEAVERFMAATGADIRIGGDKAFYLPSLDYIALPDPHYFQQDDAAERTFHFESTLLHEAIHWSGAKHRLARDLTGRFKSDAYAMEELCAEIGAAFLCAELGLTAEPRMDHAQYLAHWLKVLKADKKAIFTAAAKASEAARYLASFSRKEQDDAA